MKSCATSGTGGQPSWGQSKGVANTNRSSGTPTALHIKPYSGYVNKYITICKHDDLDSVTFPNVQYSGALELERDPNLKSSFTALQQCDHRQDTKRTCSPICNTAGTAPNSHSAAARNGSS